MMDGESNYFLGVDKPSAETVVQGKITPPVEAVNTSGRCKLSLESYTIIILCI